MYSLVASAIVLLLCSVVVPLDALPGGAPLGACQSLTPSHTGATSRPNPGPTMLNLASFMDASGTLTYIPGETYEVILMRRGTNTYRGFLIQGRLAVDGTTPVGSFMGGAQLPAGTRLSDCVPAEISVTHSNGAQPRIEYETLSFMWTAPSNNTGPVQFHWTTVVNFSTFWVNEISAVVQEQGMPASAPGLKGGALIVAALLGLWSLLH